MALSNKTIASIVTFWRPGSRGDDWTWADEYHELIEQPVTRRIIERVQEEGIGFVDHIAPVLLGSDGRVWDGHHRIVIAIMMGISTLDVEVVEE